MSSRPLAPPPIGELVDVGGYRLHLACQGVLSHGQPMAMSGLSDEVNQAYEQLWQDLQAELVALSSQGRLIVAEGSGHYIQLERPQLVIDAIAEVRTTARTNQDRARLR